LSYDRPLQTLNEAFQRRHKIVFLAALFSGWSAIYSSLGGAYFNIVPITFEERVNVMQSMAMPWNLSTEYGPIIAIDAVGVRELASQVGILVLITG
jgi:hypothetical protein